MDTGLDLQGRLKHYFKAIFSRLASDHLTSSRSSQQSTPGTFSGISVLLIAAMKIMRRRAVALASVHDKFTPAPDTKDDHSSIHLTRRRGYCQAPGRFRRLFTLDVVLAVTSVIIPTKPVRRGQICSGSYYYRDVRPGLRSLDHDLP